MIALSSYEDEFCTHCNLRAEMRNLKQLVKNADQSPRIFIVPFLWCLLASLFDGISVGMFVPILKGAIQGDFGFLYTNQYSKKFFDIFPILGSEPGIIRPLVVLVGILLLFLVAKMATSYISSVSIANVTYLLAHNLRATSFKRCIYLGKGYFDSSSSGQLHAIITQFSAELSWKFANVFRGVASTMPIFFYLLLLWMISWKAVLVTLLLSPLVLAVVPVFRKIKKFSNENARDFLSVGSHLERVLQGIVTVKANSGEEFEIKRFTETSDEAYRSGYRLYRRLMINHTVYRILALVTFGVCGLALLFILGDDIKQSMPSYLIYIVILKRTVDMLQILGGYYGQIQAVSGLVDNINSLYSQPIDEFKLVDGTIPFTGISDRIEIRNLDFDYVSGAPVLRDVSFTIKKGEAVALVGPSGSGKSTLAQLILRLYDAPEGTILIDGIDIRDYSLVSLRERTAYVNQSSNLFDDTLRNNLTYGISREIGDAEIVEALEKAKLGKFLAELPEGLDSYLGEQGVRISGGEAQRVAIARAILKKVDFFILDEATSALDANTEQEVQDAIDALVESKTLLVIAHRFSTLKNVDRILTISDGRIVEEGPLAELLEEEGMFAKLWKAQELFV